MGIYLEDNVLLHILIYSSEEHGITGHKLEIRTDDSEVASPGEKALPALENKEDVIDAMTYIT